MRLKAASEIRACEAREKGATLMEIAVGLLALSILSAAAAYLISQAGRKNVLRKEAQALVDMLFDLRSKATTGMVNPCLDFPDPSGARAFQDMVPGTAGYDPSDRVIGTRPFQGGVVIRRISGGKGPTHLVCFEGKGILGSASTALEVSIGAEDGRTLTIRLLPSTGLARVL
jgi:hypothetical protein